MVDEIAFADLATFSPINYQTISSGDFSRVADGDIVDSGEYIIQNAGSEQGFRNGNKKFIHHNHEAGYLPTHSLLMAETLTLDHIMSNFATTDNCETFKFPFMDHHALMCTLNPLGDEYYQRGGRTRTLPKPTQSSAPMIDASMIDVPELSDSRGYLYDIIGWDFQPNVATPATFIYLAGFIEADGEDLFKYTCRTPNNYADINMGYTPGTTEEECDTSCARSCKEEYPELGYITDRTQTSGMCACYCTTYPLDCNMGFSHSYYYDNEGRYFPNGTMSGRYQENNRGDAVGVFYEGQLLGWDFINNMSYGPAQGGEGYQEVYNRNTLPGVMIPLSFNDGIQPNVSQYPPMGTTLNSSNSEIILYKANTRTFHELVGNSPQDIYNTEIRLEPFNIITIGFNNLSPDGAIVEWIYDEFGNRVGPTENGYNPNMLTFTFGPPIQLPQELPPIEEPPYAGLPSNYCQTDEDCTGRLICVNNECKADRPTGQCYCECTGYGEDEYAIQHLYLDNQCSGEVDCANSCGNYCQTLGSYNMTYSQCIDSHTRQNPRQLQKNKLSNNQLSVCNSNMSYNECRQFLINNIPDSDVSTFTTWYDAMGDSGYRQILNNQVTQLEQLPSIQRLLPQENIRGQNYMPDNPNLLFCMGCNGVYGLGSCSGTCCGLVQNTTEEVVDPFTNEVIIESATQSGVGCNMAL